MADASEALEYIIFLSRHLNKDDVWSAVTLILIDLNFNENHDGFQYLRKAVVYYLQYPERTLMKVLYTDVGQSYAQKVKRKQVERSMRYAIEEAWECGDEKRWRRLFQVDKDGMAVKPTSSQFIARIAELIKVWQSCEEGEDNEEYFGTAVHS